MPAPDPSALSSRLAAARALAFEAGRATLDVFNSPTLAIDTKADGTPVTAADKRAETIVRYGIGRAYPEDSILGEEFGGATAAAGWRWIIDPIDGTKSFARGIPTYAVLIGIEFDNEPVAGIAYFPALNETLWAGRGHGAFWSPCPGEVRPARVSSTSTLAESWVELHGPATVAQSGRADLVSRLLGGVRHLRAGNDAYAFALVATGRVDASVDCGLKVWDISPFATIIPEAGGRCTDWRSGPAQRSGEMLLTNGILHDEFLQLLAAPDGSDDRINR